MKIRSPSPRLGDYFRQYSQGQGFVGGEEPVFLVGEDVVELGFGDFGFVADNLEEHGVDAADFCEGVFHFTEGSDGEALHLVDHEGGVAMGFADLGPEGDDYTHRHNLSCADDLDRGVGGLDDIVEGDAVIAGASLGGEVKFDRGEVDGGGRLPIDKGPLVAFVDVVFVGEVDFDDILDGVFDRGAFDFAEEGEHFLFRFQLFDFHRVACFSVGKGSCRSGKIPADATFLCFCLFFADALAIFVLSYGKTVF